MSYYLRAKIVDRVVHHPTLVTLGFEPGFAYEPGQFAMVWIPGTDEFPLSLAGDRGRGRLLVRVVGEGTRALAGCRVGDILFLRGPYGRPFSAPEPGSILVAGGTGLAPLCPLSGRGACLTLIGARTKRDLVWLDYFRGEVRTSTEDGSAGRPGPVTALLKEVLETSRPPKIYACGPERMMAAVARISRASGIPVECSLERLMRCGIGLCGSCSVDGLRVCRDGPVFTGEELERMSEFGRWCRDPSGRRVPL